MSGERGERGLGSTRKERLLLWQSWTFCTICSLRCFPSSSGREVITNCLTTPACQSSWRSFQKRLLKTCGFQLHMNHLLEEWNCNFRLLTTISWVTIYLPVCLWSLALRSRVRYSYADPIGHNAYVWEPAQHCCCQPTELENLNWQNLWATEVRENT